MSEVEAPATTSVRFYSDGIALHGRLVLPEGDGPHPTLVYTHGWSGAVNDRVLPLMGLLAQAGYLGLAVDHRGFASSDGIRARCDPREQIRDVVNAVTFLSTREDVDASRIIVIGASFGGAIAVGAAASDLRLAGVVSMVGFGDGERWLRGLRPFYDWYALEQRLRADAVQRVTTGAGVRVDMSVLLPGPGPLAPDDPTLTMYPEGYPLENLELAAGFSPEKVIGSIAPRPVLLISTADDTVVPLSETRQLYEHAREPRRLVVFPTGNHGGPMGPLARETAAVIVAFLGAHLASEVRS